MDRPRRELPAAGHGPTSRSDQRPDRRRDRSRGSTPCPRLNTNGRVAERGDDAAAPAGTPRSAAGEQRGHGSRLPCRQTPGRLARPRQRHRGIETEAIHRHASANRWYMTPAPRGKAMTGTSGWRALSGRDDAPPGPGTSARTPARAARRPSCRTAAPPPRRPRSAPPDARSSPRSEARSAGRKPPAGQRERARGRNSWDDLPSTM